MRNKNASENNAKSGDCMHSGRSTSNCGGTKSCDCGSTKNENRPLVKTSSESRCGEALKAQNAELTKTKCRAGCTARDKSAQMRREFEA